MRQNLICLLFTILILQACKKDINYSTLTGKYRLTQIAGGFTGAATKYSVFQPFYLHLKSDSTYIRQLPGYGLPVINDTGKYSITIQLSAGRKDTIISMASTTLTAPLGTIRYGLNISGTSLYLTMIDYTEGFTQTYIKVAN